MALACLGVFGLLGSAACSGDDSKQSQGEPAVPSTSTMLAYADRKLPLDPYLLSTDYQYQTGEAHRILTARCMARFGLEHREQPAQRPPDTRPNSTRYGVSDASTVAVYGYDPPGATPTAAKRAQGPSASADAAAQSVLTGMGQRTYNGMDVPQGGCASEAGRKLAEGTPRVPDTQLAQRLAGESFGRSTEDSRVRAVFAKWASCMKDSGFDYQTPIDPLRDPRFNAGRSAEEISAAKADVACKQRTNVVGVWFAVETAYQERVLKQNRDALETLRKNSETQLRNASTVLTTR